MAAARKLQSVPETPPPPPEGDPSLTQEAIASWTAGQRVCRARKRHHWLPFTVVAHRTFYDVVERCGHCKNRRHADFSLTGRKLTGWKPDYRDGYLLPKGAARLDDDLNDELMLTDILSRKIIAADDEED